MRRKYISPKSEKERYIMTFSLFAKEIHYIWEGNIYENSKKDLRRWEGSKKEIHSALFASVLLCDFVTTKACWNTYIIDISWFRGIFLGHMQGHKNRPTLNWNSYLDMHPWKKFTIWQNFPVCHESSKNNPRVVYL